MNDVDIDHALVSHKHSFSENCFKYYICLKNRDNITPLIIRLLKLNRYVKCFEEGTYITFIHEIHKIVLEKYSKLWIKVFTLLKKILTLNLVEKIKI